MIQLDARNYEDYTSLKKYVKSNLGSNYDPTKLHEIILHGTQLSTGDETEVEMTDSIAIAQLGTTEKTLILVCDTNDNAYDGESVTITYKSNDGETHTASASYNTTDTTTEVAFGVTDFYSLISATSSVAVQAGDNVYIGITGADGTVMTNTFGIIEAGETEATEANMYGVGSIWGRSHTNHADAQGAVMTADYRTPWGEVKKAATCTLDGSDSTTEIRWVESDGTTTVKDFHRWVHLETDTAPTSNSNEFLITDSNLANVDGSGGDVYGVIIEGATQSYDLRFYCPEGYDAWIGDITVAFTQDAVGDECILRMYIKPNGESYTKTFEHYFHITPSKDPFPILHIEEETDVYFTIEDVAGAGYVDLTTTYLEVKRKV